MSEQKEEMGQCLQATVEVTPEMVEAGFQVLARSGLEGVLEGADRLLVEEIYHAMSARSPHLTARPSAGVGSCGTH